VTSAHGFRSADRLGVMLTAGLALNLVLTLVSAVTLFRELVLLERFRRGDAVLPGAVVDAIDRSALIGDIGSWLFLATAVVWLAWQHRAHSNLRAAGVPHLAFTPGWAVGWWFVPFANLVKPFQATREVWKASSGNAAWQMLPTWPVIGWWWGTWLVGAAAGIAVGFAAATSSDRLTTVDWMIRVDQLGVVLVVPSVVTTILAIAIVRSVNRRQSALAGRVTAGSIDVPPRPDTGGWVPGPAL
jgi:hypothetical protein